MSAEYHFKLELVQSMFPQMCWVLGVLGKEPFLMLLQAIFFVLSLVNMQTSTSL